MKIVIFVVLVVFVAFTVSSFILFASNYTYRHIVSGSFGSGCNRPEGYIAVIIDSQGFNDSAILLKNHEHWPIISTSQGETVRIYVCNTDKVSAHGFAIEGYFDSGIVLAPGQSYTLSFVADKRGNFTIYCNVFCPVHWAMTSGILFVT